MQESLDDAHGLVPCVGALFVDTSNAPTPSRDRYMHLPKLAPEDDVEGATVPARDRTGGPLVDAHVHLFPDRVFAAMYRWFDAHAWDIRYRLHAEEVVAFQRSRGVEAIVGLCFAHAPGMAATLNGFMSALQTAHRDFVWGLGTVLPGEPNAREIVREALGPLELHGVKIHCHTQRIAADDPRLDDVYEACVDANKPVVIHAGRQPASAGYGVDTRAICHVSKIKNVLERHPKLRLVVPHLGADEIAEYAALLDRFEGLSLDTTMMAADYFPDVEWREVVTKHASRLLFGTDFPIIPYAWDREVQRLTTLAIDGEARRALFSGNATRTFRGS
jgi:predicted TIM-barrel fold metal-dependent hydrolase